MTGNNKVWLAPVAGLASVAMLASVGVATANAAFKPTTAASTYTVTLDVSSQSGATLGNSLLSTLKNIDADKNFGSKTNSTSDIEVSLNSTKEEKATRATIENVPADTAVSGLVAAPAVPAERTFVAWQSAGLAVDTTNAKVNADIELDARYAYNGNTSTITFEGSGVNPVTLVKGDKLADWQVPGIENPAAKGQIKGWNTNAAAVEPMDLSTLDTTKDQTLYPIYGVTYTVTYNENGGSPAAPQVQYVVSGTAFEAPAYEGTKGSEKFAGWCTKDEKDNLVPFDFSKGVTADTVLYASYKAVPTYHTVTFKFPASKNVDGTPVAAADYGADTEVVDGTQVVEPAAPSDPTDQGRPFLYWTATVDAEGCTADNRAEKEYAWSTLVRNDTNLYAVFGEATKTATKTVTFDENWQNGAITEIESNADGTFTVADPEREGYEFEGWNSQANGKGQKVDPADAEAMSSYDGKTVYAQWSRAGVSEFDKASILIGSRGFTDASYKSYTKAYNEALEKYGDNASKLTDAQVAEATEAYQAAQALLKATNTNPVYRVYNKATNKHLYTTNAAEAAGLVAAGWRDEGVSFSTVPVAPANAMDAGLYVPVYRLFNKYDAAGNQIDRHFYTADKAEYERLVNDPSWRDEGIAYYARTQGGSPVYRSYSSERYEHLFTTNQAESDNSVKLYGYRAEGIAFNAE